MAISMAGSMYVLVLYYVTSGLVIKLYANLFLVSANQLGNISSVCR